MNYRGMCFLIIFIIIHYIVYIYVKSKYSLKNKDQIDIKYIVPPVTYEDYFVFKDLDKFYNNIFGTNIEELNLIKYDKAAL